MADDTIRQTAINLMDTFHTMMHVVGAEIHKKRSVDDLSLQQFRAMNMIQHHQGTSLSQLAEHLGATVSAASKIVNGLAERDLVRRDTSTHDRRKLMLALTEAGEQAVVTVRRQASSYLAQRLETLSPGECAMLDLAMDVLRSALVPGQPASR